MNLRNKIMLAGASAVIISIMGAVTTVYFLAKANRVTELRKIMSSTLQQAEVIRQNMDHLHRTKAVDMARLLEIAKAESGGRPLKEIYASTTLYPTIPVVAAWNTVKEFAKSSHFEFLTPSHPRIPARNSKNNNGNDYKDAFEAFDKGQEEYFLEDTANERLVLARPVKLSGSCLSCHGDPAKSITHDGLDPVGFPMENMKEGDIKGAFVLVAPNTHDEVVQATMNRILMVGGCILATVMLGFYFFNRSMIIRPLSAIIAGLKQGGEQTNSASAQVSSASQSLAQGASEQAASLEETASSLEEMSSMTRKNATTAQQASALSEEASVAANKGNEAMGKMSKAIEQIQSSSTETAKIIKVIDEIAFQTNLLALNAAVEAARAGESGKGFAVVAEEVRNLAMRSAEAAKTTSAMIDQSVQSARNGVEISVDVAKMLGEITGTAKKVNGLVAEIAAASAEQAQGIDQVNTAVTQMDKVTQGNAANAEETASAAQELSTQAAAMNEMVSQLTILVGGVAIPTEDPGRTRRPVRQQSVRPEGRTFGGSARLRQISNTPSTVAEDATA
jgi:methyl-accepting chemotaxis protein